MSEYPEDGRTVGSVMILQALIGEILRSHPSKEEIFQLGSELKSSLERQMSEAVAEGNSDKFIFLSAAVGGLEDTMSIVMEIARRE